MDGAHYIPPPFPFPEAWPQRQHDSRWLTPTSVYSAQWPPASTAGYNYSYPAGVSLFTDATAGAQDEKEEDDDEYEYRYVLSDEWRDRFQSSVQVQQMQQSQQKRTAKNKKKRPQKKAKQQRQAVNAEAVAAASASRSGHLLHEIQAAKTRELARKWKRRVSGAKPTPQIEALETALNMRFDAFCDAFQPVVWPHEPLQR
ncbi:unnamed protein product [Phytophthora lilii]|uniref:Unnamed protein product n=1 Tax=Phytophthora lilii TaxID=2077276 RepID=A0A9W6TAR5_9STRA|nr:unnamed protein product [Phytophthora lilii]